MPYVEKFKTDKEAQVVCSTFQTKIEFPPLSDRVGVDTVNPTDCDSAWFLKPRVTPKISVMLIRSLE